MAWRTRFPSCPSSLFGAEQCLCSVRPIHTSIILLSSLYCPRHASSCVFSITLLVIMYARVLHTSSDKNKLLNQVVFFHMRRYKEATTQTTQFQVLLPSTTHQETMSTRHQEAMTVRSTWNFAPRIFVSWNYATAASWWVNRAILLVTTRGMIARRCALRATVPAIAGDQRSADECHLVGVTW